MKQRLFWIPVRRRMPTFRTWNTSFVMTLPRTNMHSVLLQRDSLLVCLSQNSKDRAYFVIRVSAYVRINTY